MKRIAFVLLVIAFIVVPSFAFAGFSSGDANILTRLEVSKDNTNWVNYLAETNPGNQTLTVSPGDTLYFRIKTWDTSGISAPDIQYTATYTNPQYVTNFDPFHAGTGDDLDINSVLYHLISIDPNAGTILFTLDSVGGNTTETSGAEIGGILAHVGANVPDQTVITATVQITGAGRFVSKLDSVFSSKAFADNQATTQVRILVSNPPVVPVITQPVTTQTFIGK